MGQLFLCLPWPERRVRASVCPGNHVQSLMVRDKSEARKKGAFALGAWGGSVALLAGGFPVLSGVAVGGAAYLTFKWFMFRAKRGMRF